MTSPHGSIPPAAAPVQSTDDRWRYRVLLAVQTIGTIILLLNGVPLYQ